MTLKKRLLSITFISSVAAIVAITLLPIYLMFLFSIQNASAVFSIPPPLFPKMVMLRNYIEVFQKTFLGRWMINSTIIAMVVTVGCVSMGLLAGYSFSRCRYRGRKAAIFFVLATQMFPPIVLLIPLFIMFSNMGLIDNLTSLGIVNIVFNIGISTWILRGFFDTFPKEIEEAAMIDGCSRIGLLWRIVVPISVPAVITVFLISFFNTWNEFLFSFILIESTPNWTTSVGLYSFIGQQFIEWNQIMSAAVVFSMPCLIIFALAQRYIAHGITLGAVKG